MTSQKCAMCQSSQLISDMVVYKNSQNLLQLFCSLTCVTSYKLQPKTLDGPPSAEQENTNSGSLEEKTGTQSEQKTIPDGGTDDSAVQEQESSPAVETDDVARLIIPAEDVTCCSCLQNLMQGSEVYQLKRTKQLFCCMSCVTKKHPRVKFDTKKCFNCLQLIMQPQKVILHPVDESGGMKELCSEKCLSSVKSRRPHSQCKLCAKYCLCNFSVTVNGEVHRLCSSSCFTDFSQENRFSWFICEICSVICSDKRLVVKLKDDNKTVCSSECLLKFKEKVETLQLCPTCCTLHRMSDMVEKKNGEGGLDFFCSFRCMKVHKVQFSSVSDQMKNPSSEEQDVKEGKPLIQSLVRVKEEPIDEEYNLNRCDSTSSQEVKQEPDVPKEDLKIGSVFSLTEDSKLAPPSLAHMDLPASCSSCQRVLMDGETVYQRKAHTDLFCSTSCLLKFYQMKSVKNACHFCLQAIRTHQAVLRDSVDDSGTMKDFCSQTCLTSFNYKRSTSDKLPIVPVGPYSQCSVCSRFCISKHEVILQDVVHKICSDPCFHRFCNINNLFMCENCGSRCKNPLRLKLEDGDKSLCSAECVTRFKQKIQTLQPCSMCCSSSLISDMTESRTREDVVELFCSKSCVMASKIQAVSASGTPLSCDNCGKMNVPVCHLAISDASIRNFCSLTCAMVFKENQKDLLTNTKDAGTQNQTQNDSEPPEQLPCAQCQQTISAAPTVIQNKKQLIFVCSPACSQEFKKINIFTGMCEHCRNKKVINTVQKVNNKTCNFCSDGCFVLHLHNLERRWGKLCSSCSFCRSVSKNVVTAGDEGAEETFCSEGCRSKNKQLLNHMLKCDACSQRGRLTQSLPLLGNVKRFCDLKCLLHFCSKNNKMVDSGSSSCKPAAAVESSPVITNVMSLSNTLKGHLNTSSSGSAPLGLLTDIQTKVVGHASVQTTPKELKNKSMLCVPLVHNKGVSCSVQTVETGAQTMTFKQKVHQKVVPVPVPVPVYVPLVLNMFTPKPVVLPVPLPVPVCLSEKLNGCDTMEEKLNGCDPTEEEKLNGCDPIEEEKLNGCDPIEEEKLNGCDPIEEEKLNGCDLTREETWNGSVKEDFNFSPEKETGGDYKSRMDTGEVDGNILTEEDEAPSPGENSCSRDDLETDLQPSHTKPKDSIFNSLIQLFFQPQTYKIPSPPDSNQNNPGDHLLNIPPHPPPAAATPPHATLPPLSATSPPPATSPPSAATAPHPPCPAATPPPSPAAPPLSAHLPPATPPLAAPPPPAATSHSAATAPLPPAATPLAAPLPPPPASSQSTLETIHKKRKVTNRKKLHLSEDDDNEEEEDEEEETAQSGLSPAIPRKKEGLRSQSGAEAWRRWILWRESQTSLGLPVSSPAVRLKTDVLECSSSELNDGLCVFIKEVKRPRGGPYSPDSIFYLCLSIQQYLFENNRLENIFSDLIYQKFSSEVTNILKHFRPCLSPSGFVHSQVEENFLWECKQLGAYSPIVLLNTLIFFCCKYFGFTTVEQHRRLSFAHILRYTKNNPNGTKTTFLRYYPPISTHQEESVSDDVPAKKRRLNENFLEMKEKTENCLRCPVRLYEFYLSKCSESMRQDFFYLQPDSRCVPSSPVWFSATPLDDAMIEAMIVRTLAIRLLQEENGGETRG